MVLGLPPGRNWGISCFPKLWSFISSLAARARSDSTRLQDATIHSPRATADDISPHTAGLTQPLHYAQEDRFSRTAVTKAKLDLTDHCSRLRLWTDPCQTAHSLHVPVSDESFSRGLCLLNSCCEPSKARSTAANMLVRLLLHTGSANAYLMRHDEEFLSGTAVTNGQGRTNAIAIICC